MLITTTLAQGCLNAGLPIHERFKCGHHTTHHTLMSVVLTNPNPDLKYSADPLAGKSKAPVTVVVAMAVVIVVIVIAALIAILYVLIVLRRNRKRKRHSIPQKRTEYGTIE